MKIKEILETIHYNIDSNKLKDIASNSREGVASFVYTHDKKLHAGETEEHSHSEMDSEPEVRGVVLHTDQGHKYLANKGWSERSLNKKHPIHQIFKNNGISLHESEDYAPKKTVKAYKLFNHKDGKLYPLFVNAKKEVPMGKWLKADEGPRDKNKPTHVQSKLGALAYRPGWHSGDLPVATHIGGKSKPGLTKPDYRPDHQVWAEVEHPDDHDWQSVANSRGEGKTAHITDQVPYNGHYRYKTNPNMTGNWIISGNMKVNRILSHDEVKSINKKAGTSDLPRKHEAIK